MARSEVSNGSPSDPSATDLAEQIATLKRDVAELGGMIADMGKARSNLAVRVAQENAVKAGEAARERLEVTRAQADDYIAHHPFAALGIVAGVGFLAGLMSARR